MHLPEIKIKDWIRRDNNLKSELYIKIKISRNISIGYIKINLQKFI